jgi:hypothetical protein
VQVRAESARQTMDALRGVLDRWLGPPRWKQTSGRVTFMYRFDAEAIPAIPHRLKVEINTREHVSVYRLKSVPFSFQSRWFEGVCRIRRYDLDELLGTKLRTRQQRKQGRYLFDLKTALRDPLADPSRIVIAFTEYLSREGPTRSSRRTSRGRCAVRNSRPTSVPSWRRDTSGTPRLPPYWSRHARSRRSEGRGGRERRGVTPASLDQASSGEGMRPPRESESRGPQATPSFQPAAPPSRAACRTSRRRPPRRRTPVTSARTPAEPHRSQVTASGARWHSGGRLLAVLRGEIGDGSAAGDLAFALERRPP